MRGQWESIDAFTKVFSPTLCAELMKEPYHAYYGISRSGVEAPTLKEASDIYGNKNLGNGWILAQIVSVFNASPSKDAEQYQSIRDFAQVFAARVENYKVTELLLFFGRYKAGVYDDGSWSLFDVRSIGRAFTKFQQYRNQEIDYIERIVKRENDETKHKNAISTLQ